MGNYISDVDAREYARSTWDKLGWITRIRPNMIAGPLYRLLGASERRIIVSVDGIQFFCDPLSHTGHVIVSVGSYEPRTVAFLRKYLGPGGRFLDIGANEGYLSAVAASIVGSTGTIVSVEPQSEVFRVLQVNVMLNHNGLARFFNKAVGESPGAIEINLWPRVNSGGASLVRKAALGRTETVQVVDFGTLFAQSSVERFDVVKIDVEGYEPEVVRSICNSLCSDRIGVLMLDYHKRFLQGRGIDPQSIENQLIEHGFKALEREALFGGYTIYAGVAAIGKGQPAAST